MRRNIWTPRADWIEKRILNNLMRRLLTFCRHVFQVFELVQNVKLPIKTMKTHVRLSLE
jgi:hypothetical protein